MDVREDLKQFVDPDVFVAEMERHWVDRLQNEPNEN